MDPKQKKLLIVLGGSCGVVAVVLAVFLVMQMGSLGEARSLSGENTAVVQANERTAPAEYPSDANIRVLKENAKALTEEAERMREAFTYSLEIPAGENPAAFQDRLRRTIGLLEERQAEQQRALPIAAFRVPEGTNNEAYAFARYVTEGQLPAEAQVPRLAQQFATIAHVSNLLFDKGAFAILSVTREKFDEQVAKAEEPAPTRRSSRRRRTAEEEQPVAPLGSGTAVPSELASDGLSCESYTIRFQARYNTIAETLNALLCDKLFIVVTDLSVTRPNDVKAGYDAIQKSLDARVNAVKNRASKQQAAEIAAKSNAELRQEALANLPLVDRVVSDPAHSAPLTVELKFDVYSATPKTAEGGK